MPEGVRRGGERFTGGKVDEFDFGNLQIQWDMFHWSVSKDQYSGPDDYFWRFRLSTVPMKES